VRTDRDDISSASVDSIRANIATVDASIQCALDVREYDAEKEQTSAATEGGGELGKMRGTTGYGDKSPSILLGRSFQVLVSETSVFGGIPRSADGRANYRGGRKGGRGGGESGARYAA